MRKFPVTAKEVMEDEEKNTAIVRATSQAYFHDSAKDDGIPPDDWKYQGEYVLILTMAESGEKIKKVVEFLDRLIKRARANKEKANTDKA
ncbi:hypothetical protein LTR66_006564 [Elasticomyces elasticus]|nr:hypothetical protein LTR66_006564 [Elasticomyces elasticus]